MVLLCAPRWHTYNAAIAQAVRRRRSVPQTFRSTANATHQDVDSAAKTFPGSPGHVSGNVQVDSWVGKITSDVNTS